MRRATLLAAALALAASAAAFGQTAILWNTDPPRPGTALREETRISLEKGRFFLTLNDEQSLDGGASATVRDTIERRYVTPAEQKIEVLESARNIVFNFGNSKGNPKDTKGHLLGRKVVGRKIGDHWIYSLAEKREPDAAEASALKQFTGYAGAVEAFGLLYGTEPRKVGETWKPDISALKKTTPGVDANLECKLEEIKPEQGDTIARVSVTGHVTARIPNHNGVIQVAVNGIILRSLRDMVDLDTQINGNFKYTGQFGKGKSQAEITAPVKLQRTVKVLQH